MFIGEMALTSAWKSSFVSPLISLSRGGVVDDVGEEDKDEEGEDPMTSPGEDEEEDEEG